MIQRLLVASLIVSSSLSLNDVSTICPDPTPLSHKIARKEGWYAKNTLVRKLQNPCALVYAGQRRAVRGDRGFAKYSNATLGFASCERDIALKRKHHVPLHVAWSYLKGTPYD